MNFYLLHSGSFWLFGHVEVLKSLYNFRQFQNKFEQIWTCFNKFEWFLKSLDWFFQEDSQNNKTWMDLENEISYNPSKRFQCAVLLYVSCLQLELTGNWNKKQINFLDLKNEKKCFSLLACNSCPGWVLKKHLMSEKKISLLFSLGNLFFFPNIRSKRQLLFVWC